MTLPVSLKRIDRIKSACFRTPWDGRGHPPQVGRLITTAITEPERPTSVLCTFDIGYHASGWWANHEYDACLHLSVTHIGEGDELVQMPGTVDLVRRPKFETPSEQEVRSWAVAFFGAEHAPKSWFEPAAGVGDAYRLPNIAHVRLFYDQVTMRPILPTGEVYDLKPWAWSPAKIVDGRLGADVR